MKALKPDYDTPEWLRSFKGCEHYTDEQAKGILETLDVFGYILLEAVRNLKPKTIPLITPIHSITGQKQVA